MSVTRRTKEEIEAGFPHEEKAKGVLFEDWLKKKKGDTPQKAKPKPSGVIRRTKEEIEAGFPHEEKAKGTDFKKWLEAKHKKESEKNEFPEEPKKVIRKLEIDPPPTFKPPQTKEEPEQKIEYIKHTERVIVETKGNSKELRALVDEAASGKGRYEWKYIDVDKDFSTKVFDKMGAEGWRLMYVMEPSIISSLTTHKLCFQRLKT